MTKKGECVWKMTNLILVPPVLQVLSRVFQELILLLSLVKLKFNTFQTKKKGWISETMLQFCAHVGCTSGAVFRRRALNMEDD